MWAGIITGFCIVLWVVKTYNVVYVCYMLADKPDCSTI